ncbi:MAG: hypothetical protein Q7S37_03770 [bacterium]|nr:hypothetical protein [bacterium]
MLVEDTGSADFPSSCWLPYDTGGTVGWVATGLGTNPRHSLAAKVSSCASLHRSRSDHQGGGKQ